MADKETENIDQIKQDLPSEAQECGEEKNPFEGQYEISCDYKLKYKDVFEGFDIIGNKVNMLGKAIRIGATIGAAALLFSGRTLVGAIAFLITFYFLMRDIVAPYSYRSKIAKIISRRKETYNVKFYGDGLRISEKSKTTNIMYCDIEWKEHKNVHVITYKNNIAVIPKRYISDRLGDIMAIAKHQFISYTTAKA